MEQKLLEQLSVQEIQNGILLPPQKDESKSWGLGGVVRSNGEFVEESVYRFYFGGNYLFKKESVEQSDDEVIYLGHLIPHWGVFLVDFTRRLWYYYKCKNTNIKLAFFGVNMPSLGFDGMGQMFHDFLKFADIDEANIIDVRKITQFKTVYVPQMGYDEDRKIYSLDYLKPFNQILSNLDFASKSSIQSRKDKGDCKKIYLSRTKFATFREAGESIIEKFFAINGFTIIYPETLSFAEMLLLMQAEVIASIEGTIAHWILFAQNAKHQIIIRKQKLENSRQPYFNIMKKVPVTYLDCFYEPIPGIPYSWDEGPFLMLFNDNIKNFAKEHNMKLPNGITSENIKSVMHFLHLVLVHFLERHKNLRAILKPIFQAVRLFKNFIKR